jgi:hypothetical protein
MSASFTQGYTFGATEQVTNTKLHNLVANANVSGIIGTEISTNASISGLSLAPITQSSKVSAISLYNLSSLPTIAGIIPNANVSIPDAIPSGVIVMWSGTVATIPSGWYLCDGNNSTPDLRDRFIVGAKQDDAGVAKTNITGSLTQSGDGTIPSHSHDGGTFATDSTGAHTHNLKYNSKTAGGVSADQPTRDGTTNDPFKIVGAGYSEGSTMSTCSSLSEASSGGAHTHSISGSSATSGTGTVVIAKYYALCFIMKA